MRYFRAFYEAVNDDDIDFRGLQAIHEVFDDTVFVLPYYRMRSSFNCEDFSATLIFKNSGASWKHVQERLEDALRIWGVSEMLEQTRIEECTIEECFGNGMAPRYVNCSYDESQIRRLLNLTNTYTLVTSSRYGMREAVVRPVSGTGKLFELASKTPYTKSLKDELEQIMTSPNLMVLNDRALEQGEMDSIVSDDEACEAVPVGRIGLPHAPIAYLVEGDVLSDADEAISILVGALCHNGRIDSSHVFTINIDEHERWARYDDDSYLSNYINPELIRAIEGNTIVLRYGASDTSVGYDLASYRLLATLLSLVEDAAIGTQLILSIPEGKPDLVARLRKRYNRPMVMISKDRGTDMAALSFEENLEKLEFMAAARDIEVDESMGVLLSKRMRMSGNIELESVFDEWLSYRNARIAFPQYASVIDEAISLGIADSEVSAQAKLEGLIGLEHVKEHIRNIIMRIKMNQCLMEKGLPVQDFSMHMAFVGSPGTGKTEVARLYGEILKDKGILSEGRVVTVSGGSGFDVKRAFKWARGSVLFVDEAYGMLENHTSITEFIAQMENNRADTVVILAGYEGDMNRLIASNPGFRSRIGFTIKFPDYSPEELREIFSFMCDQQELIMGEGVGEAVRDIVERGGRSVDQGNARFVRKLFEDCVGKQQVRLARQMDVDPETEVCLDDLRTLTVKDVEGATSSLGFEANDGRTGRELLESLIGLDPVKKLVGARMDFARMQKVKRDAGMKEPFMPMHMAFKGNPGTGKTEVARLIGRILREEGVLSVGGFYECGRQDLVSPLAGGTCAKVDALFQKARGSIIFIDEAYSLMDGVSGGVGDEAITALIDQMEKLRDEVVVILAGYTNEINELLSKNPGFSSRVKTQIEFPDYAADELIEILHHMADKRGYTLAEGVDGRVQEIIAKAMGNSEFGNARFIRNLLEDALVNQSVRLASSMEIEDAAQSATSDKSFSDDEIAELSTLLPEDFTWEQNTRTTKAIGFAA